MASVKRRTGKALTADQIKAFWFYDGDLYSYESQRGSIKSNHEAGTLKFALININRDGEEFEVIVKRTGDSYSYRMDCLEDPSEEFPLTLFRSEDEIVLHSAMPDDIIYIHLLQ